MKKGKSSHIQNVAYVVIAFLIAFSIFTVQASACMTRQQVADERTRCLYIYQNDVFRIGNYGSKHHSHSCGTDITTALQNSGDYNFHFQNGGNTYFWPYKIDTLCVAECSPGATSSCTTGQQGICSAGTKTCNSQGFWGACVRNNNPTTETCNNLDDDCDGATDEGVKSTYYYDNDGDSYGNPSNVLQACSPPAKYVSNSNDCNDNNANIKPGATEVCDNFDNNCNTLTDENLNRNAGQQGACSGNTQKCVSGAWINNNEVVQTAEVCDNIDNNCDGSTDESLTRPTSCGVGSCYKTITQTCTLGVYTPACTPGTPSSEICDGLDNNCNGQIDDGIQCTCTNGQTRDATCGIGACLKTVMQTCTLGTYTPACAPGSPTAEVCDNIDNDCDGTVDESLTRYDFCGTGICRRDVAQICTQGTYTPVCAPGNPSPEICDNTDNNCNGQIDDGVQCVCDNSDSRETTCGTGICQRTITQDCIQGTYMPPCTPGAPSDETCDDIDNDCDGQIDDGLTKSISCGTGGCQRTITQDCTLGSYGPQCAPGTPTGEICDNIDNDCDSITDEGMTKPISCGVGGCQNTIIQYCVLGIYTPNCLPGIPSPEKCDGIDNDCDGEIDEVPECIPIAPAGCMTGQDVAGERTTCLYIYDGNIYRKGSYDNSHYGHNCGTDITSQMPDTHKQSPSYYLWPYNIGTLCPQASGCNPGDILNCTTQEKGICSNGKKMCNQTAEWGSCVRYEDPKNEICNGLDDNCDGQIDELQECKPSDCLTRENVSNEKNLCLYIYNNSVYRIGTINDKHQGHDCGTDITTKMPSNHKSAPDHYLWPYNIAPLCEEKTECNPGQVSVCNTTEPGICSDGKKTCNQTGSWDRCIRTSIIRNDTCNSLDDDCDGSVDEGLTRQYSCGNGACKISISQTCALGVYTPECIPGIPSAEVCDNIDNNCDGTIDEGVKCDCNEGDARECGIDTGVCKKGEQTCVVGQWSECFNEITPQPEKCNNVDDDCDGEIDRGLACSIEDYSCLTKDDVSKERKACLYIYQDKVYSIGNYLESHQGHDCGSDVSAVMEKTHLANPKFYLWPYVLKDICPDNIEEITEKEILKRMERKVLSKGGNDSAEISSEPETDVALRNDTDQPDEEVSAPEIYLNAGRSTAMIAFFLIALSSYLGVFRMSLIKVFGRKNVIGSHIIVSFLAIMFSVVHIGALLLDNVKWSMLSVYDALIPGSSLTGTSLYLSLGVVAMYMFLFITLNGVLFSQITKKMGYQVWIWAHRTTYAAYVLVYFHALMLGPTIFVSFYQLIFQIIFYIIMFKYLANYLHRKIKINSIVNIETKKVTSFDEDSIQMISEVKYEHTLEDKEVEIRGILRKDWRTSDVHWYTIYDESSAIEVFSDTDIENGPYYVKGILRFFGDVPYVQITHISLIEE